MENNNPLLCNPETGICEIPSETDQTAKDKNIKPVKKAIQTIYYKDPICSFC